MNNYRSEIVESKLICPKCRSTSLLIDEIWSGHFIQWEQIDGKFHRQDGALEPGGPVSVYCNCKKCDHIWKVRKANSISDCY